MAIEMISPAGSWTFADLERMPDDGKRYELCDGVLLVTPAPGVNHQHLTVQIVMFLHDRIGPDELVLPAPGVYMADTHYRIPDVVVVPRSELEHKNVEVPPSLVVEILSPSTSRIDRVLKRDEYAEFGIAEYWIVDPVAASITALSLLDGAYVEVTSAIAADAAAVIFR